MGITGDDTALIHDARGRRWLLFRDPVAVYVARAVDEVVPALEAVERDVQCGLWAAGFVSYEASPGFDSALAVRPDDGFPLLWFAVYREPQEVTLDVLDQGAVSPIDWQPVLAEDEYRRSIEQVKEHIALGETYQVNYTYRLRAPFAGDPYPLFARIIQAQQCDYGAYVNTPDWTICCASPELFFDLTDRELTSKPMKGTAPRGLWYADDRRNADDLHDSAKNRAENVMIVDMVRNDMGRIADLGSVEVTSLFEVEQYPTLWQMTSTVRCTTNAGMTEIFRALFPPASITGAPKTRTMQIIAELENAPRRVYTGTVGFIAPDQRAQFNVAIRTVLVDKRLGIAEYGVGGGIVWDSTVGSEFEECLTKARVLTESPPEFSLLETLLWTPGDGFHFLDRHLARLMESAEYFGRTICIEDISHALRESVTGTQPLRVRLVVPEDGAPAIDVRPFTPHSGDYRVCLVKKPVDASNPFLYHKTTNRAVYEQAMRECTGYDDVLLWNEDGLLTESCIANLVVEIDGELFTPPIHCGLLPGIYRAHLLDQGEVQEREISVDDLPRCTNVFLINSVRGMWDVKIDSL